MELGDREVPAAKPDIEVEWSGFLQDTVGTALSSYGWFLLLGCILLYLLKQRFSDNISSLLTSAPTSTEDPDDVVRRQEAVAAARLKMQEELNAQAERYKEKQRQLEEEKRRQKIENWESMKEGKSHRVAARLGQRDTAASDQEKETRFHFALHNTQAELEAGIKSSRTDKETFVSVLTKQPQEPSPSTSAAPKPKPDRKPLRGGGYNPLTGDGGGTCAWRPGRRGPSAGGG